MNMLKEHRRNPTRRRTAPKRFEDEKFVSGAIDRYQHCYDANNKGRCDTVNGHENYYTSRRGHKFTTLEWNDKGKYRIHKRDFTESLLEFSSIWRDMGRILPGAIVSHIGGFLRISDVDKELVEYDDEFIADYLELSTDESASESEEESASEYESESEEEEWDSDYGSDED
jgi:hypothetical protein